ncbi:hypothetical protein YDYSY3_10660 [Paenibacillus chitinolyticus]|nr:hypothetical protein YDYSY3_10660 [Paenibacillus chitinolyticus]
MTSTTLLVEAAGNMASSYYLVLKVVYIICVQKGSLAGKSAPLLPLPDFHSQLLDKKNSTSPKMKYYLSA